MPLNVIDRRSFLLSIGRYSVAGAVLGGTGRLVFPSRGGGVRCLNPNLLDCGACALLDGCALPTALAFREAATDERDAGGGDVRSQP